MVFGDPHQFAIELELLAESHGVWMYGSACYWIAGDCVGKPGLPTTLRDVLFCWERMSYDKNRLNAELSQLNTQELMTTLCCGLYNYECADQEAYYERGIEGTWARHNINPGTESFSGWCIFWVEDVSTARCLYGYSDSGTPIGREQGLQPGEFDKALNNAIAYLLKEYELHAGQQQQVQNELSVSF